MAEDSPFRSIDNLASLRCEGQVATIQTSYGTSPEMGRKTRQDASQHDKRDHSDSNMDIDELPIDGREDDDDSQDTGQSPRANKGPTTQNQDGSPTDDQRYSKADSSSLAYSASSSEPEVIMKQAIRHESPSRRNGPIAFMKDRNDQDTKHDHSIVEPDSDFISVDDNDDDNGIGKDGEQDHPLPPVEQSRRANDLYDEDSVDNGFALEEPDDGFDDGDEDNDGGNLTGMHDDGNASTSRHASQLASRAQQSSSTPSVSTSASSVFPVTEVIFNPQVGSSHGPCADLSPISINWEHLIHTKKKKRQNTGGLYRPSRRITHPGVPICSLQRLDEIAAATVTGANRASTKASFKAGSQPRRVATRLIF